uniref:Uncharacterized protein n=1 Tax=Arundo donax TaxID=35708 RepID=A0A0A9H139_ARUDO
MLQLMSTKPNRSPNKGMVGAELKLQWEKRILIKKRMNKIPPKSSTATNN